MAEHGVSGSAHRLWLVLLTLSVRLASPKSSTSTAAFRLSESTTTLSTLALIFRFCRSQHATLSDNLETHLDLVPGQPLQNHL